MQIITLIIILLESQTLTAYSGEKAVMTVTVSTGCAARPTPSGWYRVAAKNAKAVSNLYPEVGPGHPVAGGAEMPWALFLADGIALHAGVITKPFASHGCIRLDKKSAKWLYENTPKDTFVLILKNNRERR
jgi:lipoprotein-anchoring transpeptidase ErfK/SrfK